MEDVEREMWKKNGGIIKERRENESTQGEETQNRIRKVKIETQYKTWSPNQYYTKMTWMIVAISVADFLILGDIAQEACYSPFNSVR